MESLPVRCLLSLSLLLIPASAMAETVWTSDDAALRAGPDQGYPRIDTIPAGSQLELYGCVNDWSWCDVDTGYDRGWVSSGLIDSEWRGRRVRIDSYYGPTLGFPIVTFVFGNYWDRYYRDRDWYRDRGRWAAYRPVYRAQPYPPARPLPPGPPRDDRYGRSPERAPAYPDGDRFEAQTQIQQRRAPVDRAIRQPDFDAGSRRFDDRSRPQVNRFPARTPPAANAMPQRTPARPDMPQPVRASNPSGWAPRGERPSAPVRAMTPQRAPAVPARAPEPRGDHGAPAHGEGGIRGRRPGREE